MDELSPRQRRIVEVPVGRHLLVLAPPGSGKTRTIAERVAFLLARGIAAPEEVLAMTFTERAAAELTGRLERLGHPGVTSGTFHRVCARLLREHGGEIGWRSPLRVFDERQQVAVMEAAVVEVLGRRIDGSDLRKVRFCVSRRKCGALPYEVAAVESPFSVDATRAIDEAYCAVLARAGALDFDDLIVEASRLLWDVADVAGKVHRRYRYVFVDEFHDVSPEQYRLLLALVPPRVPDRQLLAVADPNQAIFGFRGADAGAMLARLRRDYRPVQFDLIENHRSAGNIVRAAGRVIGSNGGAAAGTPVKPDHHPILAIGCADDEAEAKCLLGLIRRAGAAGIGYDEMAVLYRQHRRADRAEAALLAGDVPIRRVRPGRFFDEPAVQEGLRYLDLVAALHDDSFVPALNWPRVLVDELTMIHLRRLAAVHGIGLGQLAYRDDLLGAHCTPLTRVAIEGFRETIAAELAPLADEPVALIVEVLLDCLGRRRDPIPRGDRAALRDTLDFLGRPLEPVVACVNAAMAEGRSITVVATGDGDCAIGAAILRTVLADYLRYPHLERAGTGEVFTIVLSEEPVRGADVVIGPRVTRTVTFGVATQAWRLGQMLLMAREQLGEERFVVYDLETGSNLPSSAELVEIGARIVECGRVTEEEFARLVRPSGPAAIGRDAEDLHGIGWAAVAGAPPPEEVLPEFFAFAGEAILAGHFVSGFDDLVLRRVARSCGLAMPDNPILDTCLLARRLMPDEPHDLASLGRAFGVPFGQLHRGLPDASLNAEVLIGLIDRLQREREIDALSELLPLVALGVRASGVPIEADNALLVRLGARAAALGHGQGDRRLCEDPGPGSDWEWLAEMNPEGVEDDAEWERIRGRWREMVDDYCRGTGDHSLGAFLHCAALAKEVDYVPDPAGEGRVTMLSIHSAKGKEWPVVFVIGAEDDQFTFRDEGEEEGRRVFYVAMTRPMQRLFMLWAKEIDGRGKEPTRYLRDIPGELIEWK